MSKVDRRIKMFMCPKCILGHSSVVPKWDLNLENLIVTPSKEEVILPSIHIDISTKRHPKLYTLIDLEDLIKILEYKWVPSKQSKSKNIYVTGNIYADDREARQSMHRFLMNPPKDMLVDHRNSNPLDNRKSNLRLCTHSQNSSNKRKLTKTACKYKGVTLLKTKKGNRYASIIVSKGVSHFIGTFKTEIEGAEAYNRKARELHGEFANLNDV